LGRSTLLDDPLFQFSRKTGSLSLANSATVLEHDIIDRTHKFQITMRCQTLASRTRLNANFLKIGMDILGVDSSKCIASKFEYYKSFFKYDPARCAYIYLLIRNSILLPFGFQPKHVLWTLYFLTTYATERHMCVILKTDRVTIRKYIWPTISAIAALKRRFVSNTCSFSLFLLCLTQYNPVEDSMGEQIVG